MWYILKYIIANNKYINPLLILIYIYIYVYKINSHVRAIPIDKELSLRWDSSGDDGTIDTSKPYLFKECYKKSYVSATAYL